MSEDLSAPTPISLLQFADGLFPAGGQAHSFGLEQYVHSGQVRDSAGVEQFIRAHLNGSAGPCDSVAVTAAIALGTLRDIDACFAMDQDLDAMKHVSESREASRQMGRQTLRVASLVSGDPMLEQFLDAVESKSSPGHHPVAFGLSGSVFGWSPEAAAAAYLYSASAQLVGAALRLLPMGQLDGQRLLWSVGPLIARLAGEAADKGPEDICSCAPALEIAGMRHASQEHRLFRS